MPDTNAQTALRQYSQVSAYGSAVCAEPHRLVQLLLEKALDRLAAARGSLQHRRIPEKCAHISHVLDILDGLRLSLDKAAGGEIAQHLDDLYEYMGRRLTLANLKNDPAVLSEVASLLAEIKTAWDAIRKPALGELPGSPHVPAVG